MSIVVCKVEKLVQYILTRKSLQLVSKAQRRLSWSLLVQCEIRDPPGNFQETLKFPGALEISRGPGFFQVLEIFRAPENFQVFVCVYTHGKFQGGYRKM